MNNLSPLGLITCFVFSMAFNGASVTHTSADDPHNKEAYIINHSKYTIYFKPESRKANPGMESDAAYAVAPGESFYGPFDAVVTPFTEPGKVFRLPTGAKVVINEAGEPEPSNLIAKAGALLPIYGNVLPPFINFAKLANSKHILYRAPDLSRRHS